MVSFKEIAKLREMKGFKIDIDAEKAGLYIQIEKLKKIIEELEEENKELTRIAEGEKF